jgi:hypothetical protein
MTNTTPAWAVVPINHCSILAKKSRCSDQFTTGEATDAPQWVVEASIHSLQERKQNIHSKHKEVTSA